MATYEYVCPACGHERDADHPVGTAPATGPCPECGSVMRRRFGNFRIGAGALVTKRAVVNGQAAHEREIDRDRPAYKRMRHRGLRPEHVGGSARLEDVAGDQVDIDHRALLDRGVSRSKITDVLEEHQLGRALSQ